MYRIGGRQRDVHASVRGVDVGIPLLCDRGSNLVSITGTGRVSGGQFDWGVASQRVTEAPKGTLRLDGNQSSSAIAEACLTVRLTSRTGTKVGNSDPAVPNGRAVAQRIKATLGITG